MTAWNSTEEATGPVVTTSEKSRNDEVAALRAGFEQQINSLRNRNEELLAQPGPRPDRTPPTRREQLSEQRERLERYGEALKQRDREMLLAAGFSEDRIEWLWTRAEDLQAERRREETERRLRGLPVDPARELPYLYDNDIELRYEIGDDEYEKYLKALDKPTNVTVETVLRGSLAEAVGMKAGDRIIGYNGKRLFNFGELSALSLETARSGRTAVVRVQRDGQELEFVVPGGSLGVRSPRPLVDISDQLRRLDSGGSSTN